MKRIGIISDTHGLLRPEALAALQGSDVILHAGDIGPQQIIDDLTTIAPVTAVHGNVDKGDMRLRYPHDQVLQVEAVELYMLHILDDLSLDPAAAGFQVVVYGHSHKPDMEHRDGVLYLNPGSAGPRRFSLPVTVALMTVDGHSVDAEIVHLPI